MIKNKIRLCYCYVTVIIITYTCMQLFDSLSLPGWHVLAWIPQNQLPNTQWNSSQRVAASCERDGGQTWRDRCGRAAHFSYIWQQDVCFSGDAVSHLHVHLYLSMCHV